MKNDLISRSALIAEYDRVHQGPPGGARKLMEDAPAVTMQEWIPVSEPPEEWKREDGTLVNYMIYDPAYGIADIGNYHKPAGIWLCMGLPCKPTHWMPLPQAPKE